MPLTKRSDLRQYFQRNKIPTEAQFAELIDSSVNQIDDRIRSSPNDPLTLLPAGSGGGLLRFGRIEQAAAGENLKPTWLIRHEPGDSAAPSLLFEDAQRKTALCLQTGTGFVGVGTSNPAGTLEVNGTAVVSAGNSAAPAQGKMESGSLTIGDTQKDYGGNVFPNSNWTSARNIAGLLLEASSKTEIAVHDANTRLTSLMFYEGDAANRITIGRDMGWGPLTELVVRGSLRADALAVSLFEWRPSARIVLDNTNVFKIVTGMTLTFTLARESVIMACYSLVALRTAEKDGGEHLCTRLVFDGDLGSDKRANSITGNTRYWDNSNLMFRRLAAGAHTVEVHYRTPTGGFVEPASDWSNAYLQVVVLGQAQ